MGIGVSSEAVREGAGRPDPNGYRRVREWVATCGPRGETRWSDPVRLTVMRRNQNPRSGVNRSVERRQGARRGNDQVTTSIDWIHEIDASLDGLDQPPAACAALRIPRWRRHPLPRPGVLHLRRRARPARPPPRPRHLLRLDPSRALVLETLTRLYDGWHRIDDGADADAFVHRIARAGGRTDSPTPRSATPRRRLPIEDEVCSSTASPDRRPLAIPGDGPPPTARCRSPRDRAQPRRASARARSAAVVVAASERPSTPRIGAPDNRSRLGTPYSS